MSVTAQPYRRDTEKGWVAGVLAGLGDRLGVDPLVLRIVFVVLAIATGGLALVAYGVAWLTVPVAEGKEGPMAKLANLPRGRGDWRVALGVGLLTLSCLLAFRQLGIWWSDAVVWPLVAAAFGVALLLGRSRSESERVELDAAAPIRAPAASREMRTSAGTAAATASRVG